ncbi:hypothetical protein M885DRAFT_589214 [Pelagophyceae sp. CCMP2097]|nr:hypothetical protein M885DRAFT_589214 [Pelagophyceae sp. CCMP2097]
MTQASTTKKARKPPTKSAAACADVLLCLSSTMAQASTTKKARKPPTKSAAACADCINGFIPHAPVDHDLFRRDAVDAPFRRAAVDEADAFRSPLLRGAARDDDVRARPAANALRSPLLRVAARDDGMRARPAVRKTPFVPTNLSFQRIIPSRARPMRPTAT